MFLTSVRYIYHFVKDSSCSIGSARLDPGESGASKSAAASEQLPGEASKPSLPTGKPANPARPGGTVPSVCQLRMVSSAEVGPVLLFNKYTSWLIYMDVI